MEKVIEQLSDIAEIEKDVPLEVKNVNDSKWKIEI